MANTKNTAKTHVGSMFDSAVTICTRKPATIVTINRVGVRDDSHLVTCKRCLMLIGRGDIL